MLALIGRVHIVSVIRQSALCFFLLSSWMQKGTCGGLSQLSGFASLTSAPVQLYKSQVHLASTQSQMTGSSLVDIVVCVLTAVQACNMIECGIAGCDLPPVREPGAL